MTREIVLIDAAVEDRGPLLAGLVPGAEPKLVEFLCIRPRRRVFQLMNALMRLLIGAVLCALVSAPAFAQSQGAPNWMRIGEDAGRTNYVDTNFVRLEGNDVDVAILRNLDASGGVIRSMKFLWVFRCADGLAGRYGLTTYAGPMGTGRVVTDDGARSNAQMAVPTDPVEAENFRKVCQLIADKQRVPSAPRAAATSPVADDPKGVGGGASPD